MKTKYLFFILFCLVSKMSISQDKPEIINAEKVIQKGLSFYEAEKYEDALKEYMKIPESDTAYYAALVEEVLAYYQLKQYEKGIEVGRKALNMNLYLSPELFGNLGSSLDNIEKYEEAIKLYDDGIKLFPKFNVLYYNKAYPLMKLGKDKEAFDYYKKSAELNPFHPATHYALGILAMNEGKTSLAMLAFSTYVLLAPTSANANNALVFINEMASTKYLESVKSKGVDFTDGDDFSDIDMLIQNYVALNKKYKVKSKLEIPFVKQDYLLFDKLPEKPENKGFWYKMYVPFYKQLLKNDKFDLFANYLLIASSNEKHKDIVEKNKTKLTAFTDWIRDTWDNEHREYEMEFNGKIQKVDVFRANKRYAISSIGNLNKAKTHFVGYTELYHPNGRIKASGSWNAEGKKEGEWLWYYENGNLKSKESYVEGMVVSDDSYSFIGIIETHIPYRNEKIEGEAIAYTNDGAKDKLISFKDTKREGNYEEYYSNGQILLKGNYKNGKLEGALKTFYNSGELKSEKNYFEGDKNGQETYYYRDGKISLKSNYVKGLLQGDYISYYENGKTSDSLKYLNDKAIGNNIQYHSNGAISVTSDFDESGKLNGIRKEYDTDGKLYCEMEYKRGEIIGYKYLNKNGEIIKQDKKKSGSFDFEGFYSNGNRRSMGKYGKEDKQGEWKFYDDNGNLQAVSNYKDGKAENETTRYFPNGKLKKIIKYKKDVLEGYYIENFKNGNILEHGNYKNDKEEGNWVRYNPDKSIANEKYFIDGEYNGIQKFYSINGKIKETESFYKGTLLNSANFDTTGVVVDSINYSNASGKRVYHFYKGGPVKSEISLKYNVFEGDYTYYFPNGKVDVKGQYYNGYKNGNWKWYYWNGKLNTNGSYQHGDKIGKWEYYTEDGKLSRTIDYQNGQRNGKDVHYFEDGKIENEKVYIDDVLEGTSFYYGPDGLLEHKRQYLYDHLISYTYFEANGSEKTLEITNETGDVKIYFKNGKLARQFSLNKGLYQGEYTRYYSTGQLFEKLIYIDDDVSGEDVFYFANGKIKEKRNYYFGDLNGVQEKYYPEGKLKETTSFLYDNQHGKCIKYDKTGKQVIVLMYYDDELVGISEK